jgi:chromosomal replication initiation ATPase DnaA
MVSCDADPRYPLPARATAPRRDPMTQLVLDLPGSRTLGRADFFVSGSNAAALRWIERWPEWPFPVLLLYGEQGAGKTHLAHMWCKRAEASLVLGEALGPAHVDCLIERRGLNIAVDHADRASEEILLHLFNASVEVGANLLLTSRHHPGDWRPALADLTSRVRAAPAVGIARPDDALLAAVLVKHFADRQLRIAPEVLAYIVPRMERSLAAAAQIAASLDQAAFRHKKPITIRSASRALAMLAGQSASPDRAAGVE